MGQTLSHSEILESLGAGGMGEVYRARDTKLERDVKPANVLLTPKGGVKVLDFGIARSTVVDGAAGAALCSAGSDLKLLHHRTLRHVTVR